MTDDPQHIGEAIFYLQALTGCSILEAADRVLNGSALPSQRCSNEPEQSAENGRPEWAERGYMD